MKRLLLLALAAALLVLPASAQAHSKLRLRGTVTAITPAEKTVTVTSSRVISTLRVPGPLSEIRIGQRVELRDTTLRARGNGSRVLARNVLIVRTELRAAQEEDARVEVHGTIGSLSPLTVATIVCAVPAGVSIAGFKVGDRVEMKCVLVGTVLTLRRLESERAARDEDEDEDEDDDDDAHGGHSGRG